MSLDIGELAALGPAAGLAKQTTVQNIVTTSVIALNDNAVNAVTATGAIVLTGAITVGCTVVIGSTISRIVNKCTGTGVVKIGITQSSPMLVILSGETLGVF